MSDPEADAIVRSINTLTLAINGIVDRVEVLERKLRQLEADSCPPGVRGAVQTIAAGIFPAAYEPSTVIDNFELLHQSIVDAINREHRNERRPQDRA